MDVGVDGMLTMGVWYGMIMIMMVGGWVGGNLRELE